MVALFNARAPGCILVSAIANLGAWVKPAGCSRSMAAEARRAEQDIFPFNREALFYKGKQYGTPYYGDIYVYMHDKKAAAKAGITTAPVTLDQLKTAALEVKKAGIAQYPILKGYKTNVDGLSEFWSMVFASGGRLFNEAMDPIFPNEDKTALGVLEWMLEAMHTWQILDPKGLELDETQARDVFLSGQGVFTSNVGKSSRARTTPSTASAGDWMMRLAWGRRPARWLTGSRDQRGYQGARCAVGVYLPLGGARTRRATITRRRTVSKYGVGYAFVADNDADIIEAQRKAGYDRDVLKQQVGTARARENISAPWYNEWDRFTQQQIQNTLLRRIKPQDALVASANKARDLKKSS